MENGKHVFPWSLPEWTINLVTAHLLVLASYRILRSMEVCLAVSINSSTRKKQSHTVSPMETTPLSSKPWFVGRYQEAQANFEKRRKRHESGGGSGSLGPIRFLRDPVGSRVGLGGFAVHSRCS